MNKKRDYAVIVSIFSATVALTCVGIVVFHNFDQNGVVELGTFIGIGVALIGICATLIVGLQILNYIEFKNVKNKINNVDNMESNIINTKKDIEKIQRDYLSVFLDIYCNTDVDFDKERDKGISRLISTIVLFYKLQPNDPYRYLSTYQILSYQLNKLETIDSKPYMYDDLLQINYNINDKRSLEVIELHLGCVKRIERISNWIPPELYFDDNV